MCFIQCTKRTFIQFSPVFRHSKDFLQVSLLCFLLQFPNGHTSPHTWRRRWCKPSICFVFPLLSASNPHSVFVQEFDWDLAVKEIDGALEATAISNRPSSSNLLSTSHSNHQIKEIHKYSFPSSSRQSTLDQFIQNSTKNSEKSTREQQNRNGFGEKNENEFDSYGPSDVNIDPEAAKTWTFPGFFSLFFPTSSISYFKLSVFTY